MQLSKFLPVNLGTPGELMYTSTISYPIQLLKRAYEHIMGIQTYPDILIIKNVLSFADRPGYNWTIPEIVAAYHYYQIEQSERLEWCDHCI